jgi:hypothetical protein
MRKKKTAIELMILDFKRIQRVYESIDEEGAFYMARSIETAESYLKKEENLLNKAYKEGIEDMAVGQYYNPNHYYKNTYGEAGPKR